MSVAIVRAGRVVAENGEIEEASLQSRRGRSSSTEEFTLISLSLYGLRGEGVYFSGASQAVVNNDWIAGSALPVYLRLVLHRVIHAGKVIVQHLISAGGEFNLMVAFQNMSNLPPANAVRVHGVPKAATPAIGVRDVLREVSVAS